MDSLLHDTQFGKKGSRSSRLRSGSVTSTLEEPESRKLGILRIVNLIMQALFGIVWILNFIWVGWFEIYSLIMAYAWVFWLLNGLFIIASNKQKLMPFKWSKIMIPVYIA